MYGNNRIVVWPVAALLAFEFGMNAWLLSYGTRKNNSSRYRTRALTLLWHSRSLHCPQAPYVYLAHMIISKVSRSAFPACTMVFKASRYVMLTTRARITCLSLALRTKITAASVCLPLLYDTVIMGLTVYKALQIRALPGSFRSPVLDAILDQGMIYYR